VEISIFFSSPTTRLTAFVFYRILCDKQYNFGSNSLLVKTYVNCWHSWWKPRNTRPWRHCTF